MFYRPWARLYFHCKSIPSSMELTDQLFVSIYGKWSNSINLFDVENIFIFFYWSAYELLSSRDEMNLFTLN